MAIRYKKQARPADGIQKQQKSESKYRSRKPKPDKRPPQERDDQTGRLELRSSAKGASSVQTPIPAPQRRSDRIAKRLITDTREYRTPAEILCAPQRQKAQVGAPKTSGEAHIKVADKGQSPAPPPISGQVAKRKAVALDEDLASSEPGRPPYRQKNQSGTSKVKTTRQTQNKVSSKEPLQQREKGSLPFQANDPDPALTHNSTILTQDLEQQESRVRVQSKLTRKALRQHEAETDPQKSNKSKPTSEDFANRSPTESTSLSFQRLDANGISISSDNRMSQTTGRDTKPNQADVDKFATDLTNRGILEQQFSESIKPKNLEEIEQVLKRQRSAPSRDSDAYLSYFKYYQDYTRYSQMATKLVNETDVMMKLFSPYFGAPELDDENPANRKWVCPTINGLQDESDVECPKRPRPDYAEGLHISNVPNHTNIKRQLSDPCLVIPCGNLAFPNFTAEMKGDGSLYVAHIQNRNNGAYASRAWHEYYAQVRQKPEKSWDYAHVGSVQFNGDVVIGNVHWVSKLNGDGSDPRQRVYHMRRVFGHVITGLGEEAFQRGLEEARNFHDYFRQKRRNLRQCLNDGSDTPPVSPTEGAQAAQLPASALAQTSTTSQTGNTLENQLSGFEIRNGARDCERSPTREPLKKRRKPGSSSQHV